MKQDKSDVGEVNVRKNLISLETRSGIDRIRDDGLKLKILEFLEEHIEGIPLKLLKEKFEEYNEDYVKNTVMNLRKVGCVNVFWGRVMLVTVDGTTQSDYTEIVKLKDHRRVHD
jgi:hypothetical protein